MNSTRNDLAASVRTPVIELLAANLATAIDLALSAKQAHWNVKGPTFLTLHALFDQVAAAASGWADDLAERIVQLGGVADGTVAAVGSRSRLGAYPVTPGAGHLAVIVDRVATFAAQARAAIEAAGTAGDAVTADLFTEITAGADKQLWMAEASLG
jgi:starvation-inducible DNA-binding protein